MISKRLRTIGRMVDDNLVYDIGCDHGLLDIYLAKYKSIKCIGIDVNETIINRAINNVKKNNLENLIELKVANGFNDLNLDKNSTTIISGMGSKNIIKILKNNLTKTIIIQTNNDTYMIRKYLTKKEYKIIDEEIIFEKNKYYIAIKFIVGKSNYSELEYLLGPILSKRKDNIYYNYLKKYNSRKYIENKHKIIIKKELEKFI